jgi:hypothetical protein
MAGQRDGQRCIEVSGPDTAIAKLGIDRRTGRAASMHLLQFYAFNISS